MNLYRKVFFLLAPVWLLDQAPAEVANAEPRHPLVAVDVVNGTLHQSIRDELTAANCEIRELRMPITAEQLKGASVVLFCGPFREELTSPPKGVKDHARYDPSEVKAVADFVVNGGTLVGAGLAWTWVYGNYGDKPLKDQPLNQLGSALGFKIEGSTTVERFCDSVIKWDIGPLDLTYDAVYSIVDVGRNSVEKFITSSDKTICGAGAKRRKGRICVFGHQEAITRNPKIVSKIAFLSVGADKPNSTEPSIPRESVDTEPPSNAPVINRDNDAHPLDVLSSQAPNAIAWLTSSLEVPLPRELRENISVLREDILDKGTDDPASKAAYNAAAVLCKAMMTAIDYRETSQAGANLQVSKAKADAPMSNQALEARRNYLMSWPQYEREVQQREVLEKKQTAAEDVELQAARAKWTEKAVILRKNLDQLYQSFRTAKRSMAIPKK